MFQEYYWACFTEKRIYHSKLNSSNKEDKQLMLEHGITSKERWVQHPLSEILAMCREWKEDNFFGICTAPKYEIIDCPELSEYQQSLNTWGRLIVIVEIEKERKKQIAKTTPKEGETVERKTRRKKYDTGDTPPEIEDFSFEAFDM